MNELARGGCFKSKNVDLCNGVILTLLCCLYRSIFPKAVRARMLNKNYKGRIVLPANYLPIETPKLRLKNYLTDDPFNSSDPRSSEGGEPIADFWPNTTILFSNLSGFTAWSSTREPSQVFTLLETLYGSMDTAARSLGVFKVETVGDCYVAVSRVGFCYGRKVATWSHQCFSMYRLQVCPIRGMM
jgi:hypothetical protein